MAPGVCYTLDVAMDKVVRVFQWIRSSAGVLFALGFGALVITDRAVEFSPPFELTLLGTFLISLAASSWGFWKAGQGQSLTRELGLSMHITLGLFALALHLDDTPDGLWYPVVLLGFVVISILVRTSVATVTAGYLMLVEAAVRFMVLDQEHPWTLTVHGAFTAAAIVLGTIVLRAEVLRIRTHSQTKVAAEIERLHTEARSYRLLGTSQRLATRTNVSQASQPDDPTRLVRSSVREIHDSVMFSLELVKSSLKLHTAALLWLDEPTMQFRISELVSDATHLAQGPFSATSSILGAVSAEKQPVTIAHVKSSTCVPIYPGPCPIKTLAALPLIEEGNLLGVLIADRLDDIPFEVEELKRLAATARHVLRAVQNERVFVQLERAKVEQDKLYRAAQTLGSALSERDVLEGSVRSAREIASFDFAAVTLYDATQKTHEVRAISGNLPDHLVGLRFRQNAGLVSMVVQNRHPLPYRGQFDPSNQFVFSARTKLTDFPSVLVLPLLVHERVLGTLVLGAKRPQAFGDAVRPTLEVLARHVAVSLSNARMVRRLEELATRDGLTGLFNKRALLEMVTDKLAAAKRYSREVSVLVVDVDHFKKVNDTYGHDIGDHVLKGLGEILRRAHRETDVVARFGGEEFVILCEQTDKDGAMLLAERIREELQQTTFQSPKGEFNVTCSIGIASYPEAAADWDGLFKAADDALYVSKRSGRNRCTPFSRRHAA